MERYADKCVKCPFYSSEDRWHIYCEGVCEGTSLQLTFWNEYGKRPYKLKHCIGNYAKCRIADMLLRKYDERP